MTVRHWTGSAKLIQILNGLGHSVSNTFILELDTALANEQLHRSSLVPSSFQKEKFSTLVFDNSDFQEETLSGKGTTHCTSGIIIQKDEGECVIVSEAEGSFSSGTVQSFIHEEDILHKSKKARLSSIPVPENCIPAFVMGKRRGPEPAAHPIDSSLEIWRDVTFLPLSLDLLFSFAKVPKEVIQTLPSWTGFNIAVKQGVVPPVSKIGYLPMIDSSPTHMATVLAILQRSVRIADELQLQHIVLCFDHPIYGKAQTIRWQNPDFKERLIIRLGEFHTSMAFMAVIGRRFENSGLEDVLVDSDVVAEGSVSGVLSGTFYNRSVRVYKLLADCLCQIQWQEYLGSLPAEEQQQALQFAERLNESFPETFEELVASDQSEKLLREFQQHREKRSSENPTYALWHSLLEMIQILLLFLRGTREGNFELHLAAVRMMLHWFFAYDRQNYERYLTVYFAEMMQLKATHPDVYASFCAGEFAVQRHADNPLSKSAFDLIIEQTVNKESKTGGGWTGITKKKGAVHRWLLTRLQRTAIAAACYRMSGHQQTEQGHKDLELSRIEADNRDTGKLMKTIPDMSNPFTASHPFLFNISTGVVAEPGVMEDMLSAKEKGQQACESFIQERLRTADKDVFARIAQMQLKTFRESKKPNRYRQKLSAVKATRTMLTRVLIASRVWNISLQSVMTFNLSDIPQALANDDATMAKTDKSKLASTLRKLNGDVENIQAEVTILDSMALLHQQVYLPKTFGELAQKLLKQVIAVAAAFHSERVDFVADRYPEPSIKQQERDRRCSKETRSIHITRNSQEVPTPFHKYLLSNANKEELLSFIASEWENLSSLIPEGLEVLLAHGLVCHRFTNEGKSNVPELHCDHEEADTRMLLHAHHASSTFGSIVIKSPDTDVLVLAIAFATDISAELFLSMGTVNATKNVNATAIALSDKLPLCARSALIGLHCFTGCDSVSAFRYKGKTKALEMMLSHRKTQTTFSELGTAWLPSEELLSALEEFVCGLYGEKECADVNEVQYRLFCRDLRSEDCIPPNKDSLILHCRRANYQASIHRRSLSHFVCAPPPEQHGWQLKDDKLELQWSTLPAIPDDIMLKATCRCAKQKCTPKSRCGCQEAGLVCTELCKCCNCTNTVPHRPAQVPDAEDSVPGNSDSSGDEM